MIYVIELHECGVFGEGEKVIGYTQDINVVNNITVKLLIKRELKCLINFHR